MKTEDRNNTFECAGVERETFFLYLKDRGYGEW